MSDDKLVKVWGLDYVVMEHKPGQEPTVMLYPGRYVRAEDAERMVREAWEDGFCIAESAEGAGVWIEREWPKSQTSALLRAMMGE